MKQIKKQYAVDAVGSASVLLFEARVLKEVAEYLAENHEDCESAHTQVEILYSVVEDKLSAASEAVEFIDDYFHQRTAKKVKKTQKTTAITKPVTKAA